MAEKYNPTFQSGPYTEAWAARRNTTAQKLRTSELISSHPAVRHPVRSTVAELIRENLDACGDEGRISLPTYPVKRLLPHKDTYRRTVGVLNELYEREAAGKERVTKLLSVGYGHDGYLPWEGETVRDARAWLDPQLEAASEFNCRPVAEATTTTTRLIAAWRSANDAGIADLDVGLAFGADGKLAVDGASFGKVLDAVHDNRDRLDTRITLGANCGSARGIDKAASELPGALQFAYPNSVDAEDIRHVENIVNGGAESHTKVSVDEAARLALKHRFPIVSLCCGFCAKDVKLLRERITSAQ